MPSAIAGYAAGSVDITPRAPLPLAGYAGRLAPFAGVADPLEANVLVCRGAARTTVLVTFDLLFVGELLRRRLEAELAREVLPVDLFLTASHTHFAPATDPTLPQLGVVDGAYVAGLADRVAQLVRRLLVAPMQPLRLGIGGCRSELSVNRRLAGWRLTRRFPFLRHAVWMAPNPAGPVDRQVRVARIGADVVAWTFACHPVFLPRNDQVSADFIGFVRAALRRAFGEKTTVLFWQGFSGNIFPSFVRSMQTLGNRLRRKLLGHTPAVRADVWRRWARILADQVVAAAREIRTQAAVRTVTSRCHQIPAESLIPGSATPKQIGAQVVDFGDALRVVGVTAEPVVEYVPLFETLFGPRPVFCVGCVDSVVGYVPTAPMVAEGG